VRISAAFPFPDTSSAAFPAIYTQYVYIAVIRHCLTGLNRYSKTKRKIMLKKIFFGFFICITVNIIAQETGQLFLYIPDNETTADYLNMYSYLKA
jgi:hypothetical protein